MGSKNDGGRSAAMAQAAAEAQRARETLAAVNEPDYVKMQRLIDQMESPELVGLLQAEQLSPSALEGISLDPKLRQAQMEALTQIQEKAEAGLTPAEKARRRELARQAAAEAQSQQAAVLQSFAERGMAGSGNELAARLAAQQGSADRASQTSDRLAQDIENARMQATMQAAQQAGSLRSQDYGEAENVARARDAIAQFNAQNRQNIAAQNLGERQRISEARTGTRNLQRQQTSGLQQQQFENAYRKAGGQAAASQNLSQMYMQQASMAKPKQGFGGLLGTAAGAGLGAYATGGSPQGALAGAQVGGMLGSQFGCGGVKKEYADGGTKEQPKISAEMLAKLIPHAMTETAYNGINSFNIPTTRGKDGLYYPSKDGYLTNDEKIHNAELGNELNSILIKLKKLEETNPEYIKQLYQNASPNDSYISRWGGGNIHNYNNGNIDPTVQGAYKELTANKKLKRDISNPVVPYLQNVMSNLSSDELNKNVERDKLRKQDLILGKVKPETLRDMELLTPLNEVDLINLDNQTRNEHYYIGKEYANGGISSLQAGGANVNESFADTLAPTQKYDRAMVGFAQNRADELDRFGGDPYAAAMYGKKDRTTSESLDAVRNSPLGQKIFGSSQASSVAPQATPDALSKPEASPTPEKGADVAAGLQGLASILGKQQSQPKQEMYKPQLLDLRAQNFEDGGNKPIERSPRAVSEVGSEPMLPRQRTYSSLKDIIAESIKEKELESSSPTGTSYACGGTKKGMAYEDGGQGTVIPGDSYSGDNLPDRINSGEAVHNVEQQNRLNDLLLELKKLKTGKRTDEMLSEGELEVNPDQQEALMEVVRGQRDVTDLPDESIVQESGGMKKLMEMLARKK